MTRLRPYLPTLAWVAFSEAMFVGAAWLAGSRLWDTALVALVWGLGMDYSARRVQEQGR